MEAWKYERKTLSRYGSKWSIYFGVAAKRKITAPSVLQSRPGVSAHWDGHLMKAEVAVMVPENSLGKHGWLSETEGNARLCWGSWGLSWAISSLTIIPLWVCVPVGAAAEVTFKGGFEGGTSGLLSDLRGECFQSIKSGTECNSKLRSMTQQQPSWY